MENTYVDNLFLPFYDPKEAKANPMLANFVRYTGKDNVDFAGAYAWSAAIAFRDAVNATVKTHGVNGSDPCQPPRRAEQHPQVRRRRHARAHRPRRSQNHGLPRAHAGKKRDVRAG